MLTLRTLAIVTIGAGVFAGLPLTGAQACDDDRYPCPIRVPQETADAPAQAAPSAQPQKKASHPARPTAKAQAKPEREAPRAAARAKPSKPAAPEQAADSSAQKGAEAAPAMMAAPAMVPPPRADQPLNDASRGESPVAAAAAGWPALPATEGAGAGGDERRRHGSRQDKCSDECSSKCSDECRASGRPERGQRPRSRRCRQRTGRVVLAHLSVVDLGHSARRGIGLLVLRAPSGTCAHAHEQLVT